ncbi:MAG: AsmA family protein [Betaproteobacteria bacterium]|nr:AsmA family protein [Betaproteobacteria bacterium]
MNKFLKYGLLGVAGAGVLAAAGVVYIAATFNPNDYKAQIIQAVKDKKQRTLRLDGDIKLTFFPSIGANLGKASLSEFRSAKEFAAIDSAHISLALLPLFSRQVVVNEVVVSGLKVTLMKLKNGKTNIEDLLDKGEGKEAGKAGSKAEDTQVKFNIASVRVEKTGLDYRDETSGAHYALKDINLKTSRVANGVPCKIDFAAVIQASQPRLDLATQLKTTLTFDLEKQAYRLEGLDLQAKGAAPGIDNLAASLSSPMLEGNAKSFKTSSLTLGLDMKQPEQAFKVKLTSPVNGNLEIPQFNLSDLTVAVNATGDKLPNKSVSSEMKGSVQVDAGRQSVQVNLAGGLLQSKVKAKVALNGFSNPAIRFDVDVDQFDADLYLPKKPEGAPAKSGAAAAEQPLDLSALRKLNLDGNLRIGTLKVANIKSSQLRLGMKAHNGVLDINPLSADLYQGSMNGSATVNAAPAKPGFAINENLSGINIAPLLKDAANFDMLEGKGNVSLNLNTQGDTVTALKQALNGNMALNLADGAVKGINIAKALRSAQGMLGKGGAAQTQAANKDEKTDFSELKASFKVNNGVAHNDDLSLKSPLLRLSGNGDINIGNDSINYLAKATLAKTLEGQGGRDSVGGITVPVHLSGPFTDLKYTLDFGAIVSEAAKQKVETKKEEVKGRLLDQLKGGLKGLFK